MTAAALHPALASAQYARPKRSQHHYHQSVAFGLVQTIDVFSDAFDSVHSELQPFVRSSIVSETSVKLHIGSKISFVYLDAKSIRF